MSRVLDRLLELDVHREACDECRRATLACYFCVEGYRLWERTFEQPPLPSGPDKRREHAP